MAGSGRGLPSRLLTACRYSSQWLESTRSFALNAGPLVALSSMSLRRPPSSPGRSLVRARASFCSPPVKRWAQAWASWARTASSNVSRRSRMSARLELQIEYDASPSAITATMAAMTVAHAEAFVKVSPPGWLAAPWRLPFVRVFECLQTTYAGVAACSGMTSPVGAVPCRAPGWPGVAAQAASLNAPAAAQNC